MLGDTLFRLINIAGGLGLEQDLWQRHVLETDPAAARRESRRRIAEAAEAGRTAAAAPLYNRFTPRASLVSWW